MLVNKKSAYVLSKITDVMAKMKQASETLQDLYVKTEFDKQSV